MHLAWEVTDTLTPWSRVLPEQVICLQLLNKSQTLYGTQRFITAFTKARRLPLPRVTSNQYTPPFHLSKIHFNIILPSTPGFFMWSPSFRLHHQNTIYNPSVPIRASFPVHLSILDLITRIIFGKDYTA